MSEADEPVELSTRRKLKDDFSLYACRLEIRTKGGGFQRLVLNETQAELHQRLEAQRAEQGRVRAIVLKGRQQGVSTYVGARFYWRCTHRMGVHAFILSHTDVSTANLYGMVERYHDTINPLLKPVTGAANANELTFSALGSGYRVATAGGKDVGRSHTLQYVHGSEVAFWPNAEKHVAGLMQAVPETGDNEIVLESTANGLGGAFHTLWVAAERGESDFEAIFLPWFLHSEYRAQPGADWEPAKDWVEYGHAHRLEIDQLYWAWRKSREMGRAINASMDTPCWMFRQEYPATASEAFQVAGETPFIAPEKVSLARKRTVVGQGPIILGVDPARDGKDGTGVVDRQGRRMGARICERWRDGDLMVTAGRLSRLIRQWGPAKVFIDVGGLGAGLYDRMCELGFDRIMEAVNFGSAAIGSGPVGPEHYSNRRAEMWDALRVWHDDPAGVQVPDSDDYQMDVCAPSWGKGATRWDSSNRLVLEPKDHIRERLNLSPDLGDAAALTLAAATYAQEYYDEDDGYNDRRRSANATTGY